MYFDLMILIIIRLKKCKWKLYLMKFGIIPDWMSDYWIFLWKTDVPTDLLWGQVIARLMKLNWWFAFIFVIASRLSLGLPCTVLLRFVSEGDNTPDAIELALYLNQWKKWVRYKQVLRLERAPRFSVHGLISDTKNSKFGKSCFWENGLLILHYLRIAIFIAFSPLELLSIHRAEMI